MLKPSILVIMGYRQSLIDTIIKEMLLCLYLLCLCSLLHRLKTTTNANSYLFITHSTEIKFHTHR